jgi:hypothetical protein
VRAHTPIARALVGPGDLPDGMPIEAKDLLVKSAADSCSACSRDHRRKAFQLLEERFPAGAILRSDSLAAFARAPGSENRLVIISPPHSGESASAAGPRLLLRFHTAEDRLVGIPDSLLTSGVAAERCRSAVEGGRLHGAIEIIPYPYGDGTTFLHHASTSTVEVQCRVLELRETSPDQRL